MSKEIFYHTGLSKTGSTFLQHQVFPCLKNIHYIPTVRYRKALRIIPNIMANKVLVSREFDQQFEIEVEKFAKHYPNAKPIVVFREPGSWAVSNYKRFVKNGHPIQFREFIDIYEDKGLFKKHDFEYSRYIQVLEKHFEETPLVLLYEDLKLNPEKFIHLLGNYMNLNIDVPAINLNPKHVSYGENSLRLVRKLSRYIYFQKKLEVHRSPSGFLYNLYANAVRYAILYGSKPFPKSWFPKEPLYDKAEVAEVSDYFAKEWSYVKAKAAKFS